MSLRFKLVVTIVLVGLVPLAVSAWTTLALHQRAFDARTAELHRMSAEYGAAALNDHLDRTRSSLTQSVQAISWGALSAEERSGALWLIYKQVEALAAVSLLDESGRGVGASVYLSGPETRDPGYAAREQITLELLTAFAQRIPFQPAKAGQTSYGELFSARDLASPLLPIAVPVSGPRGATWVVAAAVSMKPLCDAIARAGAEGASAYVIDPAGRAVCRAGDGGEVGLPDPALLAAVRVGAERQGLYRFRSESGADRIAAVTAAGRGWSVIVEQDAAIAYAASARIRNQTLFWLAFSLVIALGAGLLLARGILSPVGQLLEGARRLAEGKFDLRLPVASRDELGHLSQAFNHMGAEIQARDQEIRGFNQDLQARVELRTRELRDAQEQLLHSQKMAAVTGLGAGFAHEINNPLTAVIGLSQILLTRAHHRSGGADDARVLTSIQDEAHRIRKIVRTLLSISQNDQGEGFGDVEIHQVIEDSVALVQHKLSEAQIAVIRRFEDGLPRVRGNTSQLKQVLLNLIQNSRAAMHTGGTLTLATQQVAGQAVKIEVTDTGRGIPAEHLPKIFDPFFTTKDEWRSSGLGLTVASRVVEQHKGRIQVQSEPGKGTTLTITLPVAPPRAHLA